MIYYEIHTTLVVKLVTLGPKHSQSLGTPGMLRNVAREVRSEAEGGTRARDACQMTHAREIL